MEFIVGLLRFVLVVNCAFLILLVLIQLPKKEAGLGVAFGGAATDALFGAGAGNAITKITKWCAVVFFVLSLGLAVADTHMANASREVVSKKMLTAAPAQATPEGDKEKATTVEAAVVSDATNAPAVAAPLAETNAPAPVEATPAPVAPAKAE